MHSPLLDGLVPVRAWNKLTKDIAAIIATEYALRITSNGISYNLYGIEQYEPLDAEHLRALKLYTDFSKLCSKFCTVLRWGDSSQIEHIANLTRILVETVQCYGTTMTPKERYYRGVNKTFIFRAITMKINLPWSTSTSVKSTSCFWFLCLLNFVVTSSVVLKIFIIYTNPSTCSLNRESTESFR